MVIKVTYPEKVSNRVNLDYTEQDSAMTARNFDLRQRSKLRAGGQIPHVLLQ